MIFLDRMLISVPTDWQKQVDKKLPDPQAYAQKAYEFESLPINDKSRRAGFTQYAPEVLPASRGKPIFPTVWSSDKRVKTALDAWSNGKCAYCETLINADRSQQVEHFKPKSLFPSLAYDWNNYFLACNGCNGAKLDKWPETVFIFDHHGGIAALQAESDAQLTVNHFELDRSGLRRARRVAIEYVLNMLRDVIESGLPLEEKRRWTQHLVRRAEDPKMPYSQALGQNLRRLWREHF